MKATVGKSISKPRIDKSVKVIGHGSTRNNTKNQTIQCLIHGGAGMLKEEKLSYAIRGCVYEAFKENLNKSSPRRRPGSRLLVFLDDSLRSPCGPPSGRSKRLALLSGMRRNDESGLVQYLLKATSISIGVLVNFA